MKKKCSILLFALTFLVASHTQAFAYTLTGNVWSDPTTPRYYYAAGFPSDLKTAASSAASGWNAASTKIKIAYSSSGTCGLAAVYSSSTTTSGWTEPSTNWFGLGDTLTGARVSINTYITNKYTTTQKQSVVGHEFGHVFGLGDSRDLWALMQPSDRERNYRGTYLPRADDKDGINKMY